MSRYARGTEVSVDRSEAEIRRLLQRYGADQITVGTSAEPPQAAVLFNYLAPAAKGAPARRLPVKVVIALPSPREERFTRTPSGRRPRSQEAAYNEWRNACRQQWRVLVLLIQAQLEGILNGIVTPEEAFLPWLVLAGGRTVSQWASQELTSGHMPALPAPGEGGRQA